MILITKTTTRPSTSVPWHFETPELNLDNFRSHLDLTYVQPGYLISQNNEVSEDGLTLTYTAIWQDLQSYQQYDTDPVLQVFWDERDAYYAANNVVMSEIDIQQI